FKGKGISILMGTGPGGSYDLYGRLLAAHMGKHIPGQPTIIVEHMPGAGGANAGNFIFANAPQDGSKILMTHALPLVEKLSGRKNLKFKSEKFQWIGSFGEITQILTLWHNAPVQKLDQLKAGKELVLGSMGTGHLSYQWASLLKDSIDAPYRVIAGYTNGGSLNLAMERGEIHGWVVAWESIAGQKASWLKDKKVNMLVQFTLERLPQLPNTPTIIEMATPDKRDVAELLAAGTPIARGLAYGPGVPADRVAAVRGAFDAVMKDAAFKQDAEKRQLALRHRSAAEVQKLVEKITSASPDLIARAKKAVGQK
ncbi:MAG: Bug family tripartite tricarboxylate transporter substrate binding protein, partial [Beijerinckiaceae bacterium]